MVESIHRQGHPPASVVAFLGALHLGTPVPVGTDPPARLGRAEAPSDCPLGPPPPGRTLGLRGVIIAERPGDTPGAVIPPSPQVNNGLTFPGLRHSPNQNRGSGEQHFIYLIDKSTIVLEVMRFLNRHRLSEINALQVKCSSRRQLANRGDAVNRCAHYSPGSWQYIRVS